MLINNNFLNVNKYKENKLDTTIIITHGLGEYSKSYVETALALNKHGFNVYTYDIRGHGKSEGKRGSVNSYKDFLKDLNYLVNMAYKETNKVYLIGHSMGGIITNIYTSLYNSVDGVIITASPTNYLEDLKMMKYFPKMLINNKKIPTNFFDSKLVHNNEYKIDAFDLKYFRFKIINEVMFKGMRQLIKNYKEYTTPILLIYSENDKLAPISYGKHLLNEISSKDKELKTLKESKHNIFNDIEKDKVLNLIIDWIEKRS